MRFSAKAIAQVQTVRPRASLLPTRQVRMRLASARFWATRLSSLLTAAAAAPAVACGIDVDLGGTADSGAPDTSIAEGGANDALAPDATLGDQCDPCNAVPDCAPKFTCAQFAGDTYCGALCDGGTGCGSTEACQTVTTSAGGRASACVPKGGTCAAAPPPPAKDGGVLTQCGDLVGPTVDAGCHSCGRFSNDCQPNGCYGGWWCNTYTHYCQRPPYYCP
jgi:hypothetical protein